MGAPAGKDDVVTGLPNLSICRSGEDSGDEWMDVRSPSSLSSSSKLPLGGKLGDFALSMVLLVSGLSCLSDFWRASNL